ncbi:MAG: hypothetical protein M1838_000899 [Thelocarpon superellum]|nr:MAG: hypothetical protein M1838_000899 [Thelocarpon superellum]
MASGYGLNGGVSRCFPFWQELLACYVVNTTSDDDSGKTKCHPALEDYYECLHHKKEPGQAVFNMAHAVGMSRAKVILLAIELIVDNNLAGLRSLIRVHPRTLYLDLVLRMLLTALPESTSPNTYTRFLQELVKGFPEDGEAALFEIKDTAVEDITEDEARLRVRSLHLLPLLYSPALSEKTTDPLTLFLIHRAHRIDMQTGVLTLLPELIVPFLDQSEALRNWELQRVLHNSLHRSKQSDQDWLRLHEEIVWMWKWGTDMRSPGEGAAHSIGVFFKLSRSTIEREFLKALLDNARYDLAIQTHLHTPHKASLLSRDEVEKAVLETTLAFYDQASNGNRTRGGMKKASEIVNAFRGEFESSAPLHRVEKLLEATHALSFYSLTLSHGLPFQPVNIRVHQDPIALLGKVLEQNARSYSKLDDLLLIGRNFLDAGLLNPKQDGGFRDITPAEQERLVARTQSRITGMAIEAALTEDDFDTAYSYVMNRIAQGMQQTSDLSAIEDASTDHDDTTSWRAAFQAGRYRPMKLLQRSSTSLTKTANADLRIQEMRMELLAQALLVAPAAALPEILGVWRRCEEELNALLAQETEAEEQWDDQGDQKIPGQFMSAPATKVRRDASGRGTGDEAPVGLFDVARGAAAALSKTAFPLRSAGSGGTSRGSGSGGGEDAVGRELNEEGRVRKRDVVSNIVTGGLASGIGWVLGATPAPAQDME